MGRGGASSTRALPQRAELDYAARLFGTIEINGTFYSLQRPESFERWYRATPPGFVFSVKGARFITHMKRLRDIDAPLANFFASGVFNLREKLGPILWQFPPSFRYEPERLERFLRLLPRDTEEALALARRRDGRVRGRARLAIDARRRVRHAIEIRHESFSDPSFVELLRKHAVSLVVADAAGRWPCFDDVTTDFVYVRLHGDEELYASGYGRAALERWAGRIRAWHEVEQPRDARRTSSTRQRRLRDVYCYFDNDAKVRAPFDAATLQAILGLGSELTPLSQAPDAIAPG